MSIPTIVQVMSPRLKPENMLQTHLNEGETFRRTIRRLMVAATTALAGGATLTILASLYLASRRRTQARSGRRRRIPMSSVAEGVTR